MALLETLLIKTFLIVVRILFFIYRGMDRLFN